jgi:hypothetical protein
LVGQIVVLVAEHWWHWPSTPQAGIWGLGHSLSAMHARQVPLLASQAGVGFVHSEVLVDEHTPHEPLGWQAGMAGLRPAHWLSLEQATHMPLFVSHTGAVPAHRALFAVEHWPQAPAFIVPDGWQAGVPGVPAQSKSLAQGTHLPSVTSHTGV